MKKYYSLFLILLLTVILPVSALAGLSAKTEDEIPNLTTLAKKLQKGESSAAWQAPLPNEIDDLQVIPGLGVLVGQTTISWDTDVYIPSYGPYILLDTETGRKKWEFPRRSPYEDNYNIVTVKPVILIADSGIQGMVYSALDPETGKQRWSYKTQAEQHMAVDSGRQQLMVVERSALKKGAKEDVSLPVSLSSFDLTTGKLKWKATIDGIAANESLPDLQIVSENLLLAGNSLASFTLADGQRNWTLPNLGPVANDSFMLKLAGGQLLFPNERGKLLKIDASGRVLWQTDLGTPAGAMVEHDGFLYIQQSPAGKSDSLSCISLSDGKKLWNSSLNGFLTSELLPAEGKLIFVVKNPQNHEMALEFRDLQTGKSVSRALLPAETFLRLSDRLIHYPGQVVIVGERWTGAFRINDGQKLWFYIIPGTELTYYSLVNNLGWAITTQFAPSSDPAKKPLNFDAAAAVLSRYIQKTDTIRLQDPNISLGEMQSIFAAQRIQAAADLAYSAINTMLSIAAAREKARDQSYIQYWSTGLRIVSKLQQQSVQGDYYVRSYAGNDLSQGVILVNLKTGTWREIRTSPHYDYYFNEYMNFRLPILSADGKRLFVRGIGLDPSQWKPVKDKVLRVDPYDTIHILPAPSILAYDIGNIEFLDAAKYAPSHFYGYADASGKFVIEPQYDLAMGFENGYAGVKVNGRYGIIDKSGRFALEPKYDQLIGINKNGYMMVKSERKCGIIDSSFRVIAEPIYDDIGFDLFREGFAVIKKDGKFGYIDQTGQVVIPPQYAWACNFSEGLAACLNKGGSGWGYIDKNNKFVIPSQPQWTNAEEFHEGLALVTIKNKIAYIDKTGTVVIPLKYTLSYGFHEGLAVVQNGFWDSAKSGVIDRTGKLLVELKYNHIDSFANGMARVKTTSKKYGMIDTTGKEIVPPVYDDCDSQFVNGYLHVKSNEKWYYLDKAGQLHEKPSDSEPPKDSVKSNPELTPKTLGPRYWEK